MQTYIDVQRRFRDLTKAELEDSDFLASLDDTGLGSSVGWAEILTSSRVILLAEAGSGKTAEMREQARRLVSEGKAAFFVPLEALDAEPLTDLLLSEESRRLLGWKEDGQAPAWFFLDAVDELKLIDGKLDRALRRFAKAIESHTDRARVIISCRPNDWRPELDMATVLANLPLPEKQETSDLLPDEAFLNALHKEGRAAPDELDAELDDETTIVAEGIRAIVLLPMSARQIKEFARQAGIEDAEAFLSEISRRDAWTFARRPLDLSELIIWWSNAGRLGTRAEQHQANIILKLRDDPDRPDRGLLTETEARQGAQRLALALALTKTRTIRSPDQVLAIRRDEGALDPTDVLPDWTESKRQSLLRRALFDPATYGRIRFHHRSVQEYLAAQYLRELREKGMSTKALFRLLFADMYGEQVIIPSMRPIAAWIALWEDGVRKEITRREPEVLLTLGDPESLTVSARAEILRSFVNLYGKGGWRGLHIPTDEVRRLSHPDLAPTVRDLWGDGLHNTETRDLLIEVIMQGSLTSCADLAKFAAFDATWTDHQRAVAIRALISFAEDHVVQEITSALLKDRTVWPNGLVSEIAPDLFPRFTSVDELISLMEIIPEPKGIHSGFAWSARRIAEDLNPGSEIARNLRDSLASLIWKGRHKNRSFHNVSGRFDYLTPALATLLERQLPCVTLKDDAFIRACVVASRFGRNESSTHKVFGRLRCVLRENRACREKIFWAEMAIMDEVSPSENSWHRLYNAEHESLIGAIELEDAQWLEAALAEESRKDRHPVALHALLNNWNRRGRPQGEVDHLLFFVRQNTELEEIWAERTAQPQHIDDYARMEEERAKRRSEDDAKEAQRLDNWRAWRQDLVTDTAAAFSAEKVAATTANLYVWLTACAKSNNKYNVWSRSALSNAFGSEIAEKASDVFRAHWRAHPPTLWSMRAHDARDSMLYGWLYGLCGVAAEADRQGWAKDLSEQEARIAVAYSTLELNGFAPFISDLIIFCPADTEAVLAAELDEQIKVGDSHSYLPLLHDVSYGSLALRSLLAPRVLKTFRALATSLSTEVSGHWTLHVAYMLRILAVLTEPADRSAAADACLEGYQVDPDRPLGLVLLRGLFQFDPERGAQALGESLRSGDQSLKRLGAINAFAALFGGHSDVDLEAEGYSIQPRVLGDLIRLAYAYVRTEDDRHHEGVYTPGTRDEAERARNYLLSKLIEMRGPEARDVILELANEPDFAHFPDRLRLLARQRAAKDAEFPAYRADAVVALERRHEAPPSDRDGLFYLMIDRLDDLAHEISHHDFTDRRTLGAISEEEEMQRTLALRIDAKANGAYTVTREDEAADKKRTDIRLSAVRGDQKAVIEIKLADERWSLTDLEWALQHQLLGQYLRHANCRAGCLLLTYNGQKTYWEHPETHERLGFGAMVSYLNDKAHALETDNIHKIRLSVIGLDLTDPVLVPAHRKSRKSKAVKSGGTEEG